MPTRHPKQQGGHPQELCLDGPAHLRVRVRIRVEKLYSGVQGGTGGYSEVRVRVEKLYLLTRTRLVGRQETDAREAERELRVRVRS